MDWAFKNKNTTFTVWKSIHKRQEDNNIEKFSSEPFTTGNTYTKGLLYWFTLKDIGSSQTTL